MFKKLVDFIKYYVFKIEPSMKDNLINLVQGMEAEGYPFDTIPPQFVWSYPELPGYTFKVLITSDFAGINMENPQ